MAQYRNPFDDSHAKAQTSNPRGPVTTRHREIEKARLAVQKEGKSPNKGRFRYVNPLPKRDAKTGLIQHDYDPYTTTYAVPGGEEVVIVERERPKVDPLTQEQIQPPREPHDRRIRVNGREFSQPAGELYLREKFGIPDDSKNELASPAYYY